MNIEWRYQSFDALTVSELYAVLQLRAQVFVLEQQCLYQDLDGVDQEAMHLLAYDGDRLAGYLRIFVKDGETVIGRIVTAADFRGNGLGPLLMERALEILKDAAWPKVIYLMAQQYLERFYQRFGFETCSQPYDEDGIPHIDMRLTMKD